MWEREQGEQHTSGALRGNQTYDEERVAQAGKESTNGVDAGIGRLAIVGINEKDRTDESQ